MPSENCFTLIHGLLSACRKQTQLQVLNKCAEKVLERKDVARVAVFTSAHALDPCRGVCFVLLCGVVPVDGNTLYSKGTEGSLKPCTDEQQRP